MTETATLTGTHFLFADAAPRKQKKRKYGRKDGVSEWEVVVSAGTSNSLNAYAFEEYVDDGSGTVAIEFPVFQ